MCIVLYILFGYSKGIHLFLFNLKTSKVQKQPLGIFCKKTVLKNFATFTQTSVLESLFNKVEGLKVCKFIKKRLQHRCFPVNIANFLKTSTLENINELLNFLDLKLITIEYRGRQSVLGVFQNYCSCESYTNLFWTQICFLEYLKARWRIILIYGVFSCIEPILFLILKRLGRGQSDLPSYCFSKNAYSK